MEKYLNKIYRKLNKDIMKQTYQNGWKVKMDIYTTKEQQKIYEDDTRIIRYFNFPFASSCKPEPRVIIIKQI